MSNSQIAAATVHLGVPPAKNQTVSEEISELGLLLLRSSPNDVTWFGAPTTIQMNYGFYRTYISQFLTAAVKEKRPRLAGKAFSTLEYTGTTLNILMPKLVISWGNIKIADEVTAGLREAGFVDGMIRGKPVLMKGAPSIEDVKMAKSAKAIETSPCSEGNINIHAFRQVLFLIKIATVFLKVNQYPAFLDPEHESDYAGANLVDKTAAMEVDEEDDDNKGDGETVNYVGRNILPEEKVFSLNLQTAFKDMPCSYVPQSAPRGHGLFFQYFSELSKFDFSTVPATVKRHFFHLLGDNEEEANQRFEDILTAWGNAAKTETGKILSHIFYMIDMCLTLQTRLAVLETRGIYCGTVMLGVGYTLTVGGRLVEPQDEPTLTAATNRASPHEDSLWKIFQKLSFVTNEDRVARYLECRSMWTLKHLLETLPIEGGTTTMEAIKKLGRKLYFPGDQPLPVSAESILRVCKIISEPTADLATLPYLHHSALFSADRIELALAAFGSVAPSFRIPTGRKMRLDESFSIQIRSRDAKTSVTREVKKIGASIVPLEVAVVDFKKMIKEVEIQNPFGNQVIHVSESSMFRTFEKEQFEKVLTGLRLAVGGVKVEGGAKGKKRSREDEAEGSKKKRKGDEF